MKRMLPALVLALVAFLIGYMSPRRQRRSSPMSESSDSGAGPATAPTPEQLDALRALPYAEATFDPAWEHSGVILHQRDKVSAGLNFYSSRDLPAAFLIDMEGKLVRQWRVGAGKWQHVDLLPGGEVQGFRVNKARSGLPGSVAVPGSGAP